MAELITQSSFAKRIGVTHTAIYRAVHSGRIDVVETKQGKRINWDTELPKFVKSSSNPRVRKKFPRLKHFDSAQVKRHSKLSTDKSENSEEQANGKEGDPTTDRDVYNMRVEDMDVGDVVELTTAIKAKKAQLEYEKAAGKVIDIGEVMALQEEIAMNVKSAMLAIPDRVSSQIEGMTSGDIHILLCEEINHALTSLATGLRNE